MTMTTTISATGKPNVARELVTVTASVCRNSVSGDRPTIRAGVGCSRSGFTLIELLVVIAILSMLAAFVVVTVGDFLGRAYEKSTVSLVQRLQQWMDEYRTLTGSYPADGLDAPLADADNQPLRGSAALYYQLSRTIIAEEIYGTRRRAREHPVIAKFEGSEVGDEIEVYPGLHEIYDGWGTPIHYDRLESGGYQPQGGEAHYPELDEHEHPPDPRLGEFKVEGAPVVPKIGPQGRGFDLWSHGESGHEMEQKPTRPVGSWNAAQIN